MSYSLSRFIVVASVALLLVVLALYAVYPRARAYMHLAVCTTQVSRTGGIECAYRVIDSELRRGGITAAMDAFIVGSRLFNNSLDTNCHLAAHRVGDMAYYDLFVGNPNLSHYEFAPETSMCGHGFYHGFFEHMIQDNPRPDYISRVCNYFNEGPSYLHVVASTCFHAAGHGLMRAQAERVPHARWGDPLSFVSVPLQTCERLDAKDFEREMCRTGVMSIFIQMNGYSNYGFSSLPPFQICGTLPRSMHASCYSMAALMSAEYSGTYENVLANCKEASEELRNACVKYTIGGLFVNGISDSSYTKALAFCQDPAVIGMGDGALCFKDLGNELARTYTDSAYTPDCARFPAQYQSLCKTDGFLVSTGSVR